MSPSLVLYAFAGVLVAGAVVAVLQAPAGASLATAIAVPGAAALLALLCALAAGGTFGGGAVKGGTWAGVVLAFLFGGMAAWRGAKAASGVTTWRTETARYAEAKGRGEPVEPTVEAHLEKVGAPDHDKTYLRNVLFGLAGAGLVAGVVILAVRR